MQDTMDTADKRAGTAKMHQVDTTDKSHPVEGLAGTSINGGQVSEPVHLDRNRFSVLAAVGIQWSSAAAPLSMLSNLQLVLGVGGSPFFFWGYCVAAFLQLMMALSLAELASAYPHTSGQAYWVARMSSPKNSRFLSYWVGLATVWGWLFGLAGTAVYGGKFLLALGSVASESFIAKDWQVYLAILAISLVSLIVNTWGIKILPKITFPNLLFLNAAMLFIFVSLLAKASPKASASTVFLDVINATGWSSDGVVFLLSLLPGSIAISLFDAPTHASDEMPRPAEQVPKVIMGTTILNIISTFVIVVGVLFCLSNPESLLDPKAGMAVIQLCWDAWPSFGFVMAVTVIYAELNLLASVLMVYTCSRLIWSFAQTGGLHYRNWLVKVDHRLEVPVNAVYITIFLLNVTTLLVLGPSTVLNAMFGASAFFIINSYCIPIIILLVQGRKSLPETRSFHLGRFGLIVNLLAASWAILLIVITALPTYIPIDPSTMNWTCAYIGLCSFIMLVNWGFTRCSYEPPQPLYSEPDLNNIAGLGRV